MVTKLILGGLMLGLAPLVASNPQIFGQVSANYNQFEDKTTITVTGEQVAAQPILRGWSSFSGQHPKPKEDILLGFWVTNGCRQPNFIANGKRIVPESSGSSLPGVTPETLETNKGELNFLFVFNFYNVDSIKPLATAKSVQYQICDREFTLSSKDQAELREFISNFK